MFVNAPTTLEKILVWGNVFISRALTPRKPQQKIWGRLVVAITATKAPPGKRHLYQIKPHAPICRVTFT
uniref:SFRICE_033237 n=1 Tax=Spodoptera frugiperda TaxID=7108 RepID=A0A2H1W374_SPOFR